MAVQTVAEDLVINRIKEEGKKLRIGDDKLQQHFIRGSEFRELAEAHDMNLVEAMQVVGAEHRAGMLTRFLPFLQQIIPKIPAAEISRLTKLFKDPSEAFNQITVTEAASADMRFSHLESFPIDQLMRVILQNNDTAQAWMRAIDEYAQTQTDATLKLIDQRAKDGADRLRFPRLVIGDGPLSSSDLVQLGPYNRMGVITTENRLGGLWRRRGIFYINSASDEVYPQEVSLPLNMSGTTRVSPQDHFNTARPVHMLDVSTKKVRRPLFQSNGSVIVRERRYISGESIGKLDAHNLAMNTETFLMGQRVLIDNIRVAPDGKTKIITIEDVANKIRREIEADNIDIFTGPGVEILETVGTNARLEYANSLKAVDELIENVTKLKAIGERIPPERIINALPRILTLTTIEKFYDLWVNAFDRQEEYWPFRNLVKAGVRVGFGGGGDTTRVLAEFSFQAGPVEAYPRDLDIDDVPDIILFNETARTQAEYEQKTRSRYDSVWEEGRTTSNPYKISNVYINRANQGVEIIDQNNGVTSADYVILSLGFKNDNLVEKFAKQGITISKIRDMNNNVIGLGNEALGITINGSATQFRKDDFPTPIQNVIDILGIAENTVALWVYNLLTTKLLWKTGTLDKDKVRDLLRSHQENGSAYSQLRSNLTNILLAQSAK